MSIGCRCIYNNFSYAIQTGVVYGDFNHNEGKKMKQSNILDAETGKKISGIIITSIVFLLTEPAYAQTGTKAIDIFTGMQYGLSIIIPIVGAIIFLFLLLIYLFRIISKATFIRWSFSVIVAGAAFYISALLFYIN